MLPSRSGNPQQNDRLVRMHLTLKLETTKLAARNFLQQQAKFDDFIAYYNPASEHPSVYVVEGNRFADRDAIPWGIWDCRRARPAMAWAADDERAARLKIQGPSGKGWTALISPASAASLSVLGAISSSSAALLRFSHGSIPSSCRL